MLLSLFPGNHVWLSIRALPVDRCSLETKVEKGLLQLWGCGGWYCSQCCFVTVFIDWIKFVTQCGHWCGCQRGAPTLKPMALLMGCSIIHSQSKEGNLWRLHTVMPQILNQLSWTPAASHTGFIITAQCQDGVKQNASICSRLRCHRSSVLLPDQLKAEPFSSFSFVLSKMVVWLSKHLAIILPLLGKFNNRFSMSTSMYRATTGSPPFSH